MQERRVDRVLRPEYLADLESRPIDRLRAMRAECSEIETEVSYVRRLAQARIDILRAEQDRRARGGTLNELIAALPEILADHGPRTRAVDTRVPHPLAPSMDIEWSRGLEELINDSTLANLPVLSDDELARTADSLTELEVEVSRVRRGVHKVIDRLEIELAERLATHPG